MNTTKKILFLILVIIAASSIVPSVSAAVAHAKWTATNQYTTTIQNGQSAEFEYTIEALTREGGRFSIFLFKDNVPIAIKTYIANEPTVNNAAGGHITVTSQDYQSQVGNYTIVIYATDSWWDHTWKLNLQVTPQAESVRAHCSINSLSGQAPFTTTFTGTATGGSGSYRYIWNFADGTTSTLAQVTHEYIRAGSYTPQLTVIDSVTGEVAYTDCPAVTVTTRPVTPINGTCNVRPTQGTAPLTVQYDITVLGGSGIYATYEWDFLGTNDFVIAVKNPTYTYLNSGNYDAKVRVYDSQGNVGTIYCAQINVEPRVPPLRASCHIEPYSGIAPLLVTFDMNITGGTGPYTLRYLFDDGNELYTSLETLTHEYTAGSYLPIVVVSDSANDRVYAICDHEITVTPKEEPIIGVCEVNPTSGQEPLLTTFTITARGGSGSYDYYYYYNDSQSEQSSSATRTHTYTAGTYYPTIMIADKTDFNNRAYVACNNRVPIVVTPKITDPLQVQCSATPTSGTSPLTVTFSATATGGSGVYSAFTWDFEGNGINNTQGSQTTRTYTTTTTQKTYTPKVTVHESTGITATIDCPTITVNPITILPLNGTCTFTPTSGNAPLEVTFSVVATGGNGGYRYHYVYDDGMMEDASAQNTHSYTNGTYYPRVHIFDQDNSMINIPCNNGQALVVTPRITDPITATCSAIPQSGIVPLTTQFTLSNIQGGSGVYNTFAWDYLGVNQFTNELQNPSYTYTTLGTFTAHARITDTEGNVGIITCPTITVNPDVPNPLTVTCSATSSTSGTTPHTVTFSATASGGAGGYTYNWDFGDGNSATGQNTVNTFTNPNAFTVYYYPQVTVRDSANTVRSVACTNNPITVFSSITPPTLTANAGGPYLGNTSTIIMMSGALSTGPIVRYVWDFGDGTTYTATTPTAQHQYTQSRVYLVRLTVFDAAGNSATATTTATILPGAISTQSRDEKIVEELYVGKIRISGTEGVLDFLKNTDQMRLSVELENYGNYKLKDARIIVEIPELGIKQKSQSFKLDRGDDDTVTMQVDFDDVPSGYYLVKITVQDDNIKRVKYREIFVGGATPCSGYCRALTLQ